MNTLLTLIVALSTSQAFGAYVEIYNRSGQRACFGKTLSLYSPTDGAGSLTEGWTCVASGANYRVDFSNNDYLYLSAVSDTGDDFLAGRLTDYSSVTTYGPGPTVDNFALKNHARPDGTRSFTYTIDGLPWTPVEIVADRDALDAALAGKGFKKLTGRIFRGADYQGGLAVMINF